jgi:hypothetical protein
MDIGEIAANMARVTTREKIASGSCHVPFILAYDELVRSKQIVPLSGLPREQKLKYWNESKPQEVDWNYVDTSVKSGVAPATTNTKRIWICQALYVYDLIVND